jgi:kynureninase
LACQDVEADV